MARKKIQPPLEGFGKDPNNKLTVQKSLPLFALWRSGLTLAEFKILDTYLSRIDSHNPDKRTVIFTKGELENLLGLKQIKPEVLDERLKHLMETTVELSPGNSKRIDRITLFERAQAEQDDFGIWTARLTCTPSAMKYIFNIEELRYLRYKLRSVISIKSLYSYVLFTYLERNRWRKTWEEDVDDLRHILNCDNDEFYNEYKLFNQRILKRCQKELHEKTECRFIYEPIKKGRKVVAIKFTLATLADEITQSPDVIPGQLPIDGTTGSLLQSACGDEFTGAELDAIEAILRDADIDPGQYGIEIARYHWLEKAYKEFLVVADRAVKGGKPIKHRFTYFKKMLESKKGETP